LRLILGEIAPDGAHDKLLVRAEGMPSYARHRTAVPAGRLTRRPPTRYRIDSRAIDAGLAKRFSVG
jgi:hypothetical protein